jgi:biopolymer transport protein TolR
MVRPARVNGGHFGPSRRVRPTLPKHEEAAMSLSIEPQGKRGKRSLTADLNLVPYIDLLTCMVAFLLITAAWTQLAQLSTSQHGPGAEPEDLPPMAKIAIVIGEDNVNVLVNQERDILPNKDGAPDCPALAVLLKKAKGQFPDKNDVQIASADSVLFDRLTAVMDVTIAAGFPSVSVLPGGEAGL